MTQKDVKKILDKVLQGIKPENKIILVANNFVSELNNLLKQKKIDAIAVLGGSMAKNTFLKEDYDADVFVKFNYSYKGKNISEILASALKKYEFERVKGSRDYFHVQKDFLFEVVPVLDVSNIKDAENVIDMSPMHVDYFKKKGNKLEDEVRLLKAFMKANRVYGSESYINGFSGHVVDLLTIKYGSFIDVLKAASKWNAPVVIDLEKKLKDPLMELDKTKISGPLIIVDPVQENRNAAAALRFDCFNTFVESCKEFLKNPDEDFFVFKSAKQLIEKNGFLYELEIKPLKGNKDISGAKVLKVLEFLIRELENNDFIIKDFKWDYGNPCLVYFLLKNEEVNPEKIVKGPPTNSDKHCAAFKNKHKQIFEEKGFLFAKTNREFKNAKTLVKKLLKDPYTKERCVSAVLKNN